jgi:hypothetical protein
MKRNDINELLESLLNKELEILRKRFRPYKRKLLLNNKVTIGIKEREPGILGEYENTREDKQYRYTHNIYVTESAIEEYRAYCVWKMKRIGIKRLRRIIKHELIHAFVFEEFETWECIKGCEMDYSPIFLGCLYWAEGESGHPYTKEFYNTDLWCKIKDIRDFDMVRMHLIQYIYSIKETVEKINKSLDPTRKLSLSFSPYGPGITKKIYQKHDIITRARLKKLEKAIESLSLSIGFLVDSNKLLDSYNNQFTNGVLAKYHSESKVYISHEKILKEVMITTNIRESF